MINIVSKNKKVNRLEDGINALLCLDDKKFSKIIEMLDVEDNSSLEKIKFSYSTDKQDGNKSSRLEDSEKIPTMQEIFTGLSKKLEQYPEDSKEYNRIKEILSKRDIEQFKRYYTTSENERSIDGLFEILTDDDKFNLFMSSENSREEIYAYLKTLGDIFGHKRSDGSFSKMKYIFNDFYLPQLDEMLKKVDEIYQNYNLDRYTLPEYEFLDLSDSYFFECVFRKGSEPEWEVSQELQDELYGEMPDDLSMEEQAMYIYIKLCSILKYNEDYLYKDNVNLSKISSDFDKEKLEEIKPGSKVTCYEFCRLYAKLVNEIEGDIEAVVIGQGPTLGHFQAGFYTNRVSTRIEPVNINLKEIKDPTNDMMKAQNGIKLRGVVIFSDKTGVLYKAINKVYPLILKKEPVSIEAYVESLRSLPKINVQEKFSKKLEAFTEVMKEREITGNEFFQTLIQLRKSGFFGDAIKKMGDIGEVTFDGKQRHIARKILVYQNDDNGKSVSLIDTSTLDITSPSLEEVVEKIRSKKYIERKKYAVIDSLKPEIDGDSR